jgi:hypothetical protein
MFKDAISLIILKSLRKKRHGNGNSTLFSEDKGGGGLPKKA